MINELHDIANFMRQIAARANAMGISTQENTRNLQALLDTILRIQAAVVLPERI